MPTGQSLPTKIAGIEVPDDEVSRQAWDVARRRLPAYLLAHSVRSYCWGADLARVEGWSFDRQVLWTASLLHDVGLTTLPRNPDCFEVTGGTTARRVLERAGLDPERASRVDRAIVLHMQPGVTLADGVEAVLLDRATGLDVRGAGFERVDEVVRAGVVRDYPRKSFDAYFLAAIAREAAARPRCQGARLLNEAGLARAMAESPWSTDIGRLP